MRARKADGRSMYVCMYVYAALAFYCYIYWYYYILMLIPEVLISVTGGGVE
jgi:hypothetical protein